MVFAFGFKFKDMSLLLEGGAAPGPGGPVVVLPGTPPGGAPGPVGGAPGLAGLPCAGARGSSSNSPERSPEENLLIKKF